MRYILIGLGLCIGVLLAPIALRIVIGLVLWIGAGICAVFARLAGVPCDEWEDKQGYVRCALWRGHSGWHASPWVAPSPGHEGQGARYRTRWSGSPWASGRACTGEYDNKPLTPQEGAPR